MQLRNPLLLGVLRLLNPHGGQVGAKPAQNAVFQAGGLHAANPLDNYWGLGAVFRRLEEDLNKLLLGLRDDAETRGNDYWDEHRRRNKLVKRSKDRGRVGPRIRTNGQRQLREVRTR